MKVILSMKDHFQSPEVIEESEDSNDEDREFWRNRYKRVYLSTFRYGAIATGRVINFLFYLPWIVQILKL